MKYSIILSFTSVFSVLPNLDRRSEERRVDTTVEGLTANKRNTESTDIFEGTAESLNVKIRKKFDSSGRVNFANFIPVESPQL